MHEAPEVHKFGGSCLRDRDDLERIAQIVRKVDRPVVIVVSALWGTTDRLIRAAKEPRYAGRLVNDLASHHLRFAPSLVDSPLYELFQRVLAGIEASLASLASNNNDTVAYNRLLAAGERLSALVISHSLVQQGVDAHPLGAEDVGLCLEGIGTASSVDLARSAEKLDRDAFWGVPVVTGWFGEGRDGNVALLGRGGSDHTATALAALLKAQRVVLWKDVLGIYPINPRWGITSPPIPYLGYAEAVEFANTDATIIHPATVEPVYNIGIPIEIRQLSGHGQNNMKTVIGPDIESGSYIKGVACIPRVACLYVRVKYAQDAATVLGKVLSELQENEVRICSFETTPNRWRFIILQHDVKRCVEVLNGHDLEPTYAYFAAMLTFIGCKDSAEVHALMGEDTHIEQDMLHLTETSAHLLTQRVDITAMLDELMTSIKAFQA
jgi:aspartate kinase/aspartokinase/homoserine dehydrogenase 1